MKIVYLSAVAWLSISQRPHFFAKHALENGAEKLLWIEPYPSRFPNIADLNQGRHASEPAGLNLINGLEQTSLGFVVPIEPIAPLFNLINQKNINKLLKKINHFISEETILVIGKPCLLAKTLIEHFKWHQVWYDAMDDFPSFYTGFSKKSTARLEKDIALRVDRIFCSSHELLNKFSHIAEKKTSLVLNACADNLQFLQPTLPSSGKLRFGYIGTIASWFDWDWVIDLATKNPGSIIKLVGPLKTKKPVNLPVNIIIEPPIPHPEVMRKISEFDFVIIPFLQNELTKYVDPVKFYEYRLARKTILSTPFGEMLWHHKNEPRCDDKLLGLSVPDNTLIFHASEKLNDVPRWSERFSHVFSNY